MPLYLLLLLAAVCAADPNYYLSDEFINEINSKQSLWTAGRNFDPNTPIEKIRTLLGVDRNINVDDREHERIPYVNKDDIPKSFDAREIWKECRSIKMIADQSSCGSCWAVSVASAISDRICIATKGASQQLVSASNLMSCAHACGNGCQGGNPRGAWFYWADHGIVTGGPYNTTEGCQNYPFPPCEHHTTGSRQPCPADDYDTPKCSHTCEPSWTKPYQDSLIFGGHGHQPMNEEEMQAEIMLNGPITACFDVFSDFLSYKNGIYKQTSGKYEGSHAIRIIGWGEENDVKYWIIANSWNEDWGENGTFKMIRGMDDCGIEELAYGSVVKLD